MCKARELVFVREVALLSLEPRVGCWSALSYPPQETEYLLYVDINSDPSWSDSRVSMIDLDFDIVRKRSGDVSLVDEEEFEENRVRFAYPKHVVDFARKAALDITAAVGTPREPFGRHWRAWYARCFSEV